MSLSSMKILSGKGFDDREVNNLTFCEYCVMGKSKRTSFNVGKHVTEERLGYVHADLWGSPNVTPSKSGKQYFLSIIDDKTKKVWIMFLKTKDETFDMFCEWKTLVENQINKKVKVLRTDNGLEFCNMKFDDYCKKNGIERHKTCTKKAFLYPHNSTMLNLCSDFITVLKHTRSNAKFEFRHQT